MCSRLSYDVDCRTCQSRKRAKSLHGPPLSSRDNERSSAPEPHRNSIINPDSVKFQRNLPLAGIRMHPNSSSTARTTSRKCFTRTESREKCKYPCATGRKQRHCAPRLGQAYTRRDFALYLLLPPIYYVGFGFLSSLSDRDSKELCNIVWE